MGTFVSTLNGTSIGSSTGNLYWKPLKDRTLFYTGRSGLDLLETGSGSNVNAKILPSVGIFKPTDYIYHAVANFESADASGYVESRFYHDGTNDPFYLFGSCDEATVGGSDRYFLFYTQNKFVYLLMRSNTGTVFQNICKSTNTISTGWHTVRWTSTGAAYELTIDGQSAAFGVTGAGGVNNGRWLNLIPLRDNISIGCVALAGGVGVVNNVPITSTNKIDYVDYNNKHKWIISGAGNRIFDIIGTTHFTWTGADHLNYDVSASPILMDVGYSIWTKAGQPNEIVPYKSGATYDVSAYLTGYTKRTDYNGGSDIYNYAPALVDFDYLDSNHASLVAFDKSNSAHHIATVGMSYYDAANPYRWRNDELCDPRIYSDTYKNVGHKGYWMIKGDVVTSIVINLSELLLYSKDQIGNDEWGLAQYCTLQDIVVQAGGKPVFDGDNYLTWT